jgi:pimeloyl-ACP methyl ester carboxylesterase
MIDATFRLSDGRSMGFADWGDAGADQAVLWCHGGPGSRLEPAAVGPAAAERGIRVIGIDRPGYGNSTPKPGRTIADWVPDALALADHLGVARFATVGVSTGGAYALACAAMAPSRVIGVVGCCALTDMRWEEGKAMMVGGGTEEIWAPGVSRQRAIEVATETFGAHGENMMNLAAQADGPGLPPKDLEMFTDPLWGPAFMSGFPAMFAQGVVGYADDRLADGPGWGSFDVDEITCPVRVIHGELDTLVNVAQAHYTAKIVPGAELHTFPDLGHFSILGEVLEVLAVLLAGG